VPQRGVDSPPERELLGVITSHGPFESPTTQSGNQEGRLKRRTRRPRKRLCLLKGCEQRFHPRQVGQRYCSEHCQKAARKWSRWKAQQRYRTTKAGKRKRNGQSRRYRERVRTRKPPEPEAAGESARVITKKFFRGLLRPARLLRKIHSRTAKSLAALLFAPVPPCARARPRTRTALERSAHLIRTY
jgi:hypothetical protein